MLFSNFAACCGMQGSTACRLQKYSSARPVTALLCRRQCSTLCVPAWQPSQKHIRWFPIFLLTLTLTFRTVAFQQHRCQLSTLCHPPNVAPSVFWAASPPRRSCCCPGCRIFKFAIDAESITSIVTPRRSAEFVLGSLTTSTQLLLPCVHTAGTALLADSTDLRRPCLACAPLAPLRPFLYHT